MSTNDPENPKPEPPTLKTVVLANLLVILSGLAAIGFSIAWCCGCARAGEIAGACAILTILLLIG